MYWTRRITRADLEGGHVLAHGLTRLNIAPADLRMFVDPKDAALLFAFRALQLEDDFQKSTPVWMATLRRAADKDAIVESIVRAFTKIADETSLERLLHALVDEARRLGCQKLWFTPGLLGDPLFVPALKKVLEAFGQALIVNPSTGMSALQVPPAKVKAPKAKVEPKAELEEQTAKAEEPKEEGPQPTKKPWWKVW